ncbi:MAG TPA: flagellar motor protein MotB [Ruminiclostridium sp.]|nr:flagellar motor protein MotB [Ruminiclostridium sp.]
MMRPMARHQGEREEENYWPSFTDVISSLVFVLFFFIVILLIKQIVSAKSWDLQIGQASALLTEKQGLLEDTEKNLDMTVLELEQKKQEMAGLEKSLADREAAIGGLQSQLQRDQNALSQKESELSQVKSRLQEISLLRLSLLEEVKASIEAELGAVRPASGEPQVVIDDNANLVIQSSLLFAKGSSHISENGRKMLRQFSAVFHKILSNQSIQKNIDSIVISGYADSDDTYQNNYALSCERAITVITAMMEENPALEKTYGRYFQASGFSEFRPLAAEVNEAAKTKNRRIQIAINIKDSNIQEIITDYMRTQP